MPIIEPTPVDAAPEVPDRADRATFPQRMYNAFVYLFGPLRTGIINLVDNAHNNATEAFNAAQAAAVLAEAADNSAANSENSAAAAAASAASALAAPGTSATSTTSLTIGTGSKTLTIQTGKAFAPGQSVVIADTAAPAANWMWGQITAHDSGTGALTVNAIAFSGSGTKMAWTIGLSSNPSAGESQIVRSERTSNTILGVGDRSKLIDITSGTFTQTFTAAATLGDGWYCYIRNSGTGNITLDPNSTEQIDGQTSVVLKPRMTILIICTGTAFNCVRVGSFTTMEVLTSGVQWTCPAGVYAVKLRICAGGGSGARVDNAGSGGEGGGYLEDVFKSIPGTIYNYTVGAGGVAPSTALTPGNSGGNTTFSANGITYTAYGGDGGKTSSITSGVGTAINGLINIRGQQGYYVSSGIRSGGSTPLGFGGIVLGGTTGIAGSGYGSGSSSGNNTPGTVDGQPGVIILEY